MWGINSTHYWNDELENDGVKKIRISKICKIKERSTKPNIKTIVEFKTLYNIELQTTINNKTTTKLKRYNINWTFKSSLSKISICK